MNAPTVQARFWFLCREYARIKLNAGQTLRYTAGGLTDEGYDVTEYEFTFDGSTVTVSESRDARDCDGRVTDDLVLQCHVDRLASVPNVYSGLLQPDWQRAEDFHRDFAAEAMGY